MQPPDEMLLEEAEAFTAAMVDEMLALIRRCLDLTLADAQRQRWLG